MIMPRQICECPRCKDESRVLELVEQKPRTKEETIELQMLCDKISKSS
jgi:hypothetical protein